MQQAAFAGRDHVTGESPSSTTSLQRLARIAEPSAASPPVPLGRDRAEGRRGDGLSYDDDGQPNREFLARQMPLSAIEGAVVVDVVPSRG